jgi:L-lactate dehydrogenase complex protein LldF
MIQRDARQFIPNSEQALQDTTLQTALARAKSGFLGKRRKAIALVDDFEFLKQQAQAAKQRALDNIPALLDQFEHNLNAAGGQLHRAATPDDLNRIVLDICQRRQAKIITKGKSMVSEETHLNTALEQAGLDVVETDLGEYIIQLAKEPPSHIIAPAVHKTRQAVAELFRHHHALGERDLNEISNLVEEARQMLRQRFLAADVGITGANLLVASTGSIAIVTNEGNGDLTATLPPVHIVTASLEKLVENLEDAGAILEVLGRSATGQAMSAYTTFFTGPKRPSELDGPEEMHVIVLDNGRSDILQSEFAAMLRCIRCGACLNHCPVYSNVGGHAYGSVYPGPMGSVLTPLLEGLNQGHVLPNASTFCGRCAEVCPMGIPLPDLLRKLREQEHRQQLDSTGWRMVLRFYSWLATRPRWFHLAMRAITFTQRLLRDASGTRLRVPFSNGWNRQRELPAAPDATPFLQQWQKQQERKP